MRTLFESILSQSHRKIDTEAAMRDSIVDTYLGSIKDIADSRYIEKTDTIVKCFDLRQPSLTCSIKTDIYLTPEFLSKAQDAYSVNTFVLTNHTPETIITDTSDRPSTITGITFDTKNSIFVRGPLRNVLTMKKCNFCGEQRPINRPWELAAVDMCNTVEFDHCNFKNLRISIDKSTMRKTRCAFVGCRFDNCVLIFDCRNVKNLAWTDFLNTCMNEPEQESTTIADVLSMVTFNNTTIDSASAYDDCEFIVNDCWLSEYNQLCRVTIGKKLPIPSKYIIAAVALKDGCINIEKTFG